MNAYFIYFIVFCFFKLSSYTRYLLLWYFELSGVYKYFTILFSICSIDRVKTMNVFVDKHLKMLLNLKTGLLFVENLSSP